MVCRGLVVSDGHAVIDRIQFGFFSEPSCVRLRCVFTYRHPDPLSTLAPFDVVRAFGMTLFLLIDENPNRASLVRWRTAQRDKSADLEQYKPVW